ncbi:MAG TPA: helicase-related protein [Dysgonomonas sp.]|uniref:helicase-related protein n=1 Tax=unclassified Dysgonomonas TaxID=2630389 RepID=UPI0025C416BB|nr:MULTISPECIES: helicase-related protein [unclassified Dysgonomonas]HML66462.1 helicase-related protein [Dysgonomonas sp.]
MNKILQKRTSLETFIREQILGPGINGYKYVNLKDTALVKKDLKVEPFINYDSEILDIVPAAIYSTGILFPEDNSGTCNEGAVLDNNEQTDKEDGVEENDSQNSSLESEDIGKGMELNQMFPKTMGLTCCLSEQYLERGEIEFTVSFRYYRKLKQDKEGLFNKKYGLLCEAETKAFREFLSKHNLNQFSIISIEKNDFIVLAKISTEQITELKSTIRSIQKNYAENLYDKMKGVINLPVSLTKEKCYLSNLKSTIYYELKISVTDTEKRKILFAITQEIELIENISEHLRNLLDIYSGGYGLWQSNLIEKIIKIKNINFPKSQNKISFLYNKPKEREDIISIDKEGIEQKGLAHLFRFDLNEKQKEYASLSANVQLSRDSRKNGNKIFVKIQLINTSTAFDLDKQKDSRYYSTFNEVVNQRAFFGVKLCLENDFLVPYSDFTYSPNKIGIYDEDTTTRFIYDQFKDYAVGHGCSVKWHTTKKKVETEYLPECETPDIDPIPRDKNKSATENNDDDFILPLFSENSRSQEFKWLSVFSDTRDEDVINGLLAFVDSYGKWIENKKNDSKYQSELKAIADQELDKCEQDYLRMKKNIKDLLNGKNNKENLDTFRLMNAAMFMQLWHSVKVKNGEVNLILEQEDFDIFDLDFYKKADDKLFPPHNESAGWRAFQLAFILLNLDGIFKGEDECWERRNEWVDLVWFPTGGGKTEAYLGLIALTIINRRKLYREKGGGVASIMRYTLRLLTMQQFQRATLVIMALELIRRWDLYNLGREPITIGLWVGNNSLPNKTEDLIIEYEKLNNKHPNKVPFSNCPWCGNNIEGEEKVDTENLSNRENQWFANKVYLKCSNNKCSFSYPKRRARVRQNDQGAIPVCLSDEIIYQHPPTLLFGTVDKFAQLAHKINGTDNGRNADSRRLFGRGNWEQGKPQNGYLPPDLIIQDELHLLLGPLGSAVALYESAIDQLCTREDGTRPKIISSTATTRNTQLQIAALFDRKVDLFPKPGVECDDSFFAFYRRKFKNAEKNDEEYLSKRKYIGVLPTGRTQIWMQMRLTAIIMTHRAIFELQELLDKNPVDFDCYNKEFERTMDFYHSTISYFNSLKEVGKTQSQVQTYILKELRRVFNRVIRPQKLMHSLYTYGPIHEAELTGRLSGEEVKNELKNVETKWIAQNRFANIQDGERQRGKVPPEFVVATNMISVGIDVSRFNTIIMNSMPRNTAEYIQASSRVARNDYGLVLTVHHPFRARDVSHYEKFIEFHEKMYSYVEPISITPFTKKSVERYMGLYLATMIRHTTRFTERNSAGNISSIPDNELCLIISGLTYYFEKRKERLSEFGKLINNLLKQENVDQIKEWIEEAFMEWKEESNKVLSENKDFVFNNKSPHSTPPQEQLYVDIEEYEGNIHSEKWQVPMSLRVIEPEAAIKINSI